MTIDTSAYTAEIAAWRAATEAPLRRDWISLMGRFELQPGLSRIGSDLTSEIVLPAGSAPEHVGVLNFNAGEVTLGVAPGVAQYIRGVAGNLLRHCRLAQPPPPHRRIPRPHHTP